jgi:nucleotide-binding universal stress UspA family protein
MKRTIAMLKKILVPVDGSSHSIKAAELASDLASKYGAEIILLHVLLRGHMPDGLRRALEVEAEPAARQQPGHLVNMPQEIMARVKDRKTTQLSLDALDIIGKFVLSNVAAHCAAKGVETITQKVEEGYPAQVILAVAQTADVDMIVMGSRGLSELKGLLLGSVSHKVSQLSNCTCVTVK